MSVILVLLLSFSPNIPLNNSPVLRNTVMSLILPGSSQILYGSKVKGYAFVATEVLGILGKFYYNHLADVTRDKYKIFAYIEAGADPQNGNESYWYAIERRKSRDDFIEYLWRQARNLYPTDPAKQQDYVNSHLVSGTWSFPSYNSWFAYRKMRRDERAYIDDAGVMVGVIIANHIFSALDAFISTKLASRKVTLKTHIGVFNSSVSLNFRF